MSRKEFFSSNQTSFIDQAPLWQKTTQKKLNLKQNLRKNKNLKPFYFLLAFIFFLCLIYVFLIFSKNTVDERQINPPQLTSEQLELDPLEKRINSLQEDLRLADPTRQSFPFPNVDLHLSFE